MERRSIALAAVVTAAVTLASGCASKTGGHAAAGPAGAANPVGTSSPAGPASPAATTAPATATTSATSAAPTAAPDFDPLVPTISDGTSTVRVGGRAVVFPSTVTDAVWSPNGTMLAYVDGDGGIAIAHADGTRVRVLAKGGPGVERAHPAWDGERIAYAELVKGSWTISEVALPYTQGGESADWGWGETNMVDGAVPFTVASAPGVMTQNAPRNFMYGGQEHVAQVEKGGKDEVFVFDRNLRGTFGAATFAGTDPALSPDGTRVAFVGTNGQLEVAQTRWAGDGRAPAAPRQLTFGADHPGHPAWSADGTRVAFETSHDVESVASAPAAGATSNPARQESAGRGVPSYPTATALAVKTFDGTDAVAASIAYSRTQFPTLTSADEMGPMRGGPMSAVLVASDSDAAAAAAAAEDDEGQAMLFTTAGGLDPRTAAELKRLFGPCLKTTTDGFCKYNRPEITVVGTEKEIPTAVVNQLGAEGFTVTRVTAADAHDLTLPATPAGPARPPAIYVVDPADHVAALAAVRAADGDGRAVILTDGTTLTPAARAYLDSVDFSARPDGTPSVIAVGRNAATALAAKWTGKPSFHVTPLTGDAPAAQVGMLPAVGWTDLSTAVLATAQGNRAVFAVHGTVIPADMASQDVAALLNRDNAAIRTIWSLGTPAGATLDGLRAALGSPTALTASPAPAATRVVF